MFYTRAAEHGSVYPISLLGTEHTYGVAGLSLAVLIIGLLGSGCYRLGAFMLGVAPAVHASWSAWLYLIAGIAFLLDFRTLAKEVRPAIKYFVAGFAVTVASLLIQRFVIYDVPPIDPAISERYLKGFLKEWDHHRQPAPLVSVGLILNIDVLVMAIVWLAAFSRDAAPRTKFVVRAAAASAAVSLPLVSAFVSLPISQRSKDWRFGTSTATLVFRFKSFGRRSRSRARRATGMSTATRKTGS